MWTLYVAVAVAAIAAVWVLSTEDYCDESASGKHEYVLTADDTHEHRRIYQRCLQCWHATDGWTIPWIS